MKLSIYFSAAIIILVVCAASMGIFSTSGGKSFEHETVRGETALISGTGLYRFDPAVLAREGIIWDAVNLFIAIPAFVIILVFSARGSFRARLMHTGFLAYFFYVYLMYAVMMAFNIMFLAYVAVFALAGAAFFINLWGISIRDFLHHVSPRFPRKTFAIYFLILSAALVILWTGRIIPVMTSGVFPKELAGLSTFQPQAMDLGMIVPMALSAAILLLRNSPPGFFLAGIGITHGLMMFITIPGWIVIPLVQDGYTNWAEAVPFLLICLTGIFLFVLYFKNIIVLKKTG
ncbi:MAG: hypothetical protein JW904_01515 [Spirochaetales bacterium]|nr:hypothetical protein [Spirochaetales bacterium]